MIYWCKERQSGTKSSWMTKCDNEGASQDSWRNRLNLSSADLKFVSVV